jgi:tight adherence protein C
MILAMAIALLFGAGYFLMSGLTVRQKEIAVSVRRARRYGVRNQREIETRRSVNDRLIGPAAARIAGVTQRLLPRTGNTEIRQKLMSAGLGQSMTPQMYLAIRGTCLLGPIAFGLFLAVAGMGALGFLVGMGIAAIGFIAPDFYINSRVRGRRDSMQAALPDVLDLLCVSVEAGLGFDAALVKLNERMTGPLVDEFALVLHEMRIGESRSAALKNMADRVAVPEVAQFCRAIIQADQLGIALSRILRVQSHDMRIRRQLAAEERAMKAPVKMLFPTVIFIFPALFVVALGPAVLGIMKAFSGGGAVP